MSELSRQMNEVIRSGRYRGGRTGGLIDRLPDTDMSHGRTERLSAAEVRFEAAVKAGNEAARNMADAEIDAILEEARAARRAASAAEASAAAARAAEVPPTSFDGGVRRGLKNPPNMQQIIASRVRSRRYYA